MTQSRFNIFLCSTFSLFAWNSSAWSQSPQSLKPNCQNALEIVKAENLPVEELSKLGPELNVAKGNYAMTFWPIDSEVRSEKVGQTPIGFSLIQTRDLETPPIGLLIRSNQKDKLSFARDGHQILIASRQESSCPIRAIMSVTERGGVVLREMAVEQADFRN